MITQWRHVLTLTPIFLRDIAASSVPPGTRLLTVRYTFRVSSQLHLPTIQYVGVGSDRSSGGRAVPVDITSTSGNQGRYSACPIYGKSCGEMDIWTATYCAGHMACHLLPWTHFLSLTGMDTWPVTYCPGNIFCHLLRWTQCRSLTGMDTWPVTYCAGHTVGHLLGWTHVPSLTALDTWLVTYCIGHIVGHFL